MFERNIMFIKLIDQCTQRITITINKLCGGVRQIHYTQVEHKLVIVTITLITPR